MKSNIIVISAVTLVSALLNCVSVSAQEQGPDIYEQAEAEADRLQRTLELEDWQTFYVDSTLKHDFQQLMAEYDRLRESKVSNVSMYQSIQDKWMDQIDATYKKIFTEEQWADYMKSGAGKAMKAREKRKAKAEKK